MPVPLTDTMAPNDSRAATSASAHGHSTVHAAAPASSARIIFATALGNGLEVFDFTVFSFFAGYIGTAFFPTHDPLISLLLAVGTFAAGFFARPLGAAMIGSFADRVGRRAAMTLSLWLMAAGTAAIGLCPTYDTIGLAAPLLVLVGRLTQGFAAGGEIGASTTYLLESAGESQRGSRVSWQGMSQGAAAILGAASGLLLNRLMDPATLGAWGWRIPFVVGLLIAPVGYYIRRHLPDHHQPGATGEHASPLRALLSAHVRPLVTAVLLILSQTVTMYVVVYFMPSYLSRVMHYPAAIGFSAAIAAALTILVTSLLGGRLADRLGKRKPLVVAMTVLSLIACLPAFWVLTHVPNVYAVMAVCVLMTALMGIGGAATTVLLMELFPATVRASGFSLAYAIGVTLFGGTAQFVTTWLIMKTGSPMAAGGYVFFCLIVSLGALLRIREQATA